MTINLRQARERNKLSQFVKEREAAQTGNADALDRTVSSMAGKPKDQAMEKPE